MPRLHLRFGSLRRIAAHLDDQQEGRGRIKGAVVEGDDGGATRAKEISYLQEEKRGMFYSSMGRGFLNICGSAESGVDT